MRTAGRGISGLFALSLGLSACGGGGGDDNSNPNPPPGGSSYTLGGTVSGLSGSGLVLQNSGGSNLPVNANGAFTFPASLASGASYSVTVLTQPSTPSQTCTVTGGGNGTVGSANITSVVVTCTTNTYNVGGSVSGLIGSGLVLQNNSGNDISISADGTFTFSTAVASGGAYAVTVKTQPTVPPQTCSVSSGSGTVTSAAVTSVSITCASQVGKFLYVNNTASNTVSAYSINASSGALTQVSGSPFVTADYPVVASADPLGTSLYVSTWGSVSESPKVSAYAINPATGALIEMAGSPFLLSTPAPPPGIAALGKPIIHPTGLLGYAGITDADGKLYGATVDVASGTLNEVAGNPTPVGANLNAGIFNAAGNILYVTHDGLGGGAPGAVSAFSVNVPSGALTPIGTYATGGETPLIAVLAASGKFLLTPNAISGSLAVFAVDATSGTLTPAPGSPFTTGGSGAQSTHVSVHPSQNYVYVTNGLVNNISAFQLDGTTGALTPIAGSPFPTNGGGATMAKVDPSGKFLFVTDSPSNNIQAYVIDANTGGLTSVPGSPFATESFPGGVSIDPSGKYLYCANAHSDTVSAYAINRATGALTLINTVPAGDLPQNLELVGLQ